MSAGKIRWFRLATAVLIALASFAFAFGGWTPALLVIGLAALNFGLLTFPRRTEMQTCPSEAVLGPGDEHRYPCTYPKGRDGPHSWHGIPNPPSVAGLPKRKD